MVHQSSTFSDSIARYHGSAYIKGRLNVQERFSAIRHNGAFDTVITVPGRPLHPPTLLRKTITPASFSSADQQRALSTASPRLVLAIYLSAEKAGKLVLLELHMLMNSRGVCIASCLARAPWAGRRKRLGLYLRYVQENRASVGSGEIILIL